jgi:DNA-binding transcriptional LysR family regulator
MGVILMELNQLNYFRTVARLQNVTKAAEELYISQPNLSTSITRLETSLGVALFERKKGKIKLTPNGEIFLAHVDRMFQELDTAMSTIKEQEEYTADRLALASSISGLVPKFFTEYYVDYGLVPTEQYVATNEQVSEMLLKKELDAAVLTKCPSSPDVDWYPICSDELVAMVLKDNPAANIEHISLKDFRFSHFICNELYFDRHSLEALCKNEDFIPNIVRLSNEADPPVERIFDFGNNVMIIPSMHVPTILEHSETRPLFRRLHAHYNTINIGLARHKARAQSAYHDEFCSYAIEKMRSIIKTEREKAAEFIS